MRPRLNGWTINHSRNNAASARMRLFCFPYAGGGATVFSAWPRSLPPEVEVIAVQPPGREGRLSEKPFSDLMQLVGAMHAELLPLMDRPFVFYGHSNGGLMAFELTRTLRRTGGPLPLQLFIGGRPAPQVKRDECIHNLPHDEFIEELRRYSGTPEEILQNAEIMELIMPLLRADFSLGETYEYQAEPPLAIPITAYGGERDDEVPPDEIEVWSEQTSDRFRCKMFDGDHFFMNGNRAELLQDMSAELRQLEPLRRTMVHGF